MGEAMLAAVLKNDLAAAEDVCVSDISAERREYLHGRYGVTATAGSRGVVGDKDVVVLAVKPQNINEVMNELKGSLRPGQLVISIVAGVKLDTLSKGLALDRIVRAMPNTPAQVGYGITGWTPTSAVTDEDKDRVRAILGAMGEEIFFDSEDALDKITAVSGSGPAYFFLFAEYLINAGVNIGLSREEAGKLVRQTMLGAAHLLDESGEQPSELRRNVTSPGGTTERAIEVFIKSGLAEIIDRAVRAAFERSRELGS